MKQAFQVGDRVRYTFPREPSLRDVDDDKLTSTGTITQVYLRLGKLVYVVRCDTPVLSATEWAVHHTQRKRLKKLRTKRKW
jgi:hypothetical protein